MNKKRYGIVFVLCIVLFAAGVRFLYTGSRTTEDNEENAKQEEGKGEDKLTIWLDKDNEYDVRYRTAFYKKTREKTQGTDQAAYFTDMDFELVNKNHLSGQQYREELARALENGEGPDIIYMDEYNGVNPLELMEGGRLAPLGEEFTKRIGESLEYTAGSLEAGMKDGKNYVLPIGMECPVVFGIREELEAAGIQTDKMYGSLDEFLDALLAAQEKTGKKIFESQEAVDWLEKYYMPENEAGKLSQKLASVRERSGGDTGQLGAYYGLSKGECLLGGCGIYDYKKLGVNVSLLGNYQLALLSIPDSSGSMRGLITNSAAVNIDSPNAREACKALLMFQLAQAYWPDINVINEKENHILVMADTTGLLTPSVLALPDKGISNETAEEFIKCSVLKCSGMSYVQEYGERVLETGVSGGQKKVVSICFTNMGDGDEYPLARWLNEASASYMQYHEDTYVQMLSRAMNMASFSIQYQEMDVCGTAPDALICPAAERLLISGINLASGVDFCRMLEDNGSELDFLPDVLKGGIRYGEAVIGLPVQVREYGAWASRRMLEQAGLTGEWKPEDATELTEGMEKLARAVGPSYVLFGTNELESLALFAEPDTLLAEQEDGSFCCSKESWVSSLAMLKGWKDAGTALPVSGAAGKQKAMQELAEGKTGLVFGCSTLSGYIDGAYGAAMTKEQQEDLVFLPLSPAADADVIFVSGNSNSAEEVFAFWKEALQHPDYEDCIRANSGIPVTEVSENVRQIFPLQEMNGDIVELWNGLWETDIPAEDLAEKYPLYEWAADQ